ncbi:hypothetical protein AAKU67_000615 [Oxalobacteraceae bacterium GrIS 2.11]
MGNEISLDTLQRAFACASNKEKFSAGSDYRRAHTSRWDMFIDWLIDRWDPAKSAFEIRDKKRQLMRVLPDFVRNLLNNPVGPDGNLSKPIAIEFDGRKFILKSDGGKLCLLDYADPKKMLELGDINEFKTTMFKAYLREYSCTVSACARNFNLQGVSFFGEEVNAADFDAARRAGADLNGAKIIDKSDGRIAKLARDLSAMHDLGRVQGDIGPSDLIRTCGTDKRLNEKIAEMGIPLQTLDLDAGPLNHPDFWYRPGRLAEVSEPSAIKFDQHRFFLSMMALHTGRLPTNGIYQKPEINEFVNGLDCPESLRAELKWFIYAPSQRTLSKPLVNYLTNEQK